MNPQDQPYDDEPLWTAILLTVARNVLVDNQRKVPSRRAIIEMFNGSPLAFIDLVRTNVHLETALPVAHENHAAGETTRTLSTIAQDIRTHWPVPNYAAVPYLRAMTSLTTMASTYGADDARSIVMYFLSNAATWRGEHARRIKAELKAMLATNNRRRR